MGYGIHAHFFVVCLFLADSFPAFLPSPCPDFTKYPFSKGYPRLPRNLPVQRSYTRSFASLHGPTRRRSAILDIIYLWKPQAHQRWPKEDPDETLQSVRGFQ